MRAAIHASTVVAIALFLNITSAAAADSQTLRSGYYRFPALHGDTVDNLPHATFMGEDAQLEAAVNLLKEEIRKDPRPVPAPPPYPDKSFPYQN